MSLSHKKFMNLSSLVVNRPCYGHREITQLHQSHEEESDLDSIDDEIAVDIVEQQLGSSDK